MGAKNGGRNKMEGKAETGKQGGDAVSRKWKRHPHQISDGIQTLCSEAWPWIDLPVQATRQRFRLPLANLICVLHMDIAN